MKRFLLSLLIAVPLFSIAQSNFQKGYVVTNSQDTLRGYVNYKESLNNPSSVTFKGTPDAKPEIYTLETAAAYQVDGHVKYERFKVKISMDRPDLEHISVGLDSTFRTDTVFLQQLQTGKNVTLYNYQDGIKSRFYLKDADVAIPYELLNISYLSDQNEMKLVNNTRYRRQLLQVFKKFGTGSPAEEKKLSYLDYKTNDLMKVTALINDQQLERPKSGSTRFFAGTGVMISRPVYAQGGVFTGAAATSKTSVFPMLSAGVDLLSNPVIGKMVYRLEGSFFMSKNEINDNDAASQWEIWRHSFDQYTITLAPQVIYNIYNGSRLKFFVGGGISANYSIYKNNTLTKKQKSFPEIRVEDNPVKFEQFNLSVPFTAGIVLHKKVELSVGYTLPNSLTRYDPYTIRAHRYKAGINYLFGKN